MLLKSLRVLQKCDCWTSWKQMSAGILRSADLIKNTKACVAEEETTNQQKNMLSAYNGGLWFFWDVMRHICTQCEA